ncbi:hypothetical protein P9314_03845 [Paenibacillus validus]|uniref:Uncharacterized protein n=1 Tax=Paenibacillus validus TaxID=44253 RepID=A0A7X2Z9E2_9BACL|nr:MULTISPECIES: hypothetical protein [Paenibacillus]MED4599839.1 hypothetical protein [Paenibacillus validus]MED4606555.1 hypothetical protein [Paenibacillus validus]MUG70785.1 hypothetical protein [Paenibacillus validus]
MEVNITEASMTHSKEDGYLGRVVFGVTGQQSAYELTLQSKNARDWSYSLSFTASSGKEEDIYVVESRLEEDDELFDALVDAAMQNLQS